MQGPHPGQHAAPAGGGLQFGPWALPLLIAPIPLILALAIPVAKQDEYQHNLAWALFATACVIGVLAPVFGPVVGLRSAQQAWMAGAIAAGGLVAFWLLIGLGYVDSNRGFGYTAATLLACLGLYFAPGRP